MNRVLNRQTALFATTTSRRLTTSAVLQKYKKQYYVDPDPQIGDYPNLPHIKAEERPQNGWWDRQNRRNFGEPIHEHDEVLNMRSPTVYRSPGWKVVGRMWAGVIVTIGSIYYIISQARAERPYMRAFYPNGLKDELGGVPARTMADAIREASA
ncbi:hypothetical protein LPJ77_001916 [Coemansia sp. RSA 2523]|nr:hypothetical protein LPJ54_000966 [Coemansia sp. RSA 1824]KAJ1809072.1 hypothetical protein LPJ77_001916 [Coemansia sp. RSA 2523]KAJ2153837.1 hypothetical protein J3F82_001670 [Coemansia sp. RSA 637]KAJ2238779.1 hypothetical protein GGH97_005281 [Coemansia sp. RSA 475]KAJ2272630.1 hypothetical protein EV176_003594 [Coemansia sp. RSA 451]KAJ2429028.1 hypothetical protein GGF47_001011 [Coemansia sp. RSA 2524]KAJ2572519.1 hypothetical protein GGH19_004707 [Coemansia sp. RSA 1807]